MNAGPAVRRQSISYELRGLVEKQSSYDSAAVGSGSVVNQVQFAYNSFAQATTEYQEHAGAVNTSTSVKVQQAFADGSAGHVRPTKTTYPNGRILRYEYNSGTDDAINRISFLADDSSGSVGTHLAEYAYLGLGGIASEDFTQPQVKLDYDTAADGTYAGLDRFDRVLTHLWRDYGASADRDKFTYSYDRAGNRVYRENAVPSALDEFYTYDNVNRLTISQRGDLNAGKTAISGTPVREEDFTLDMTGNWPTYLQKTSGTTTLNQSCTHNPVNEITAAGSWATPAHDRAGNMTTVPKPSSLANGLTLKFDAWNRVVEVKDGATVVGKYEYDAIGRRVKRHIDSQSPSGPNGVDRYEHLFYEGAQVIETRGTTNVNDAAQNLQPKYQYVWSLRYIDAPILRDENTDTDNLCDDARIYFLNDANMNVTSLVDTASDALERYVYDLYGRVTIYNATWSATRSSSSYSNTTLYTGRDLDQETGFYFYRARYYSAELGRFVGRDPIGFWAGDMNLYGYCANDPVDWKDPYGLFSGFTNCDANETAALQSLEQQAQLQIDTLKKQIEDALTAYKGRLDALTVLRLKNALSILDKASKKLKTAQVVCDKKGGYLGMAFPWGNTVTVGRPFWLVTDKCRAATLVHEGTHMGAGLTDWVYFWQKRKWPSNQNPIPGVNLLGLKIIGWDIIASTYDSWILNGFFIPGFNDPTGLPPPPDSHIGPGAPPDTPLIPQGDDNPNRPRPLVR